LTEAVQPTGASPAADPELTANFTGREWVFRALADWLQQGQATSFLLTGGPGAGKSTIAARLVEMAGGKVPSAVDGLDHALVYHHFCHARDPHSLEPRRLIEGLSLALCSRYEVCAKVAAEQAADAAITVNIDQVSAESVRGVVINNLHVSERLDLGLAFDRIVRRPLEALRKSGEQRPVLALIDSLDEAVSLGGDQHIPWLIERVVGESSSGGLRLILTSRPEPAATRHVVDSKQFDLIRDAPDDVDDVKAYVLIRFADFPEERREKLATAISVAGKGNFLYARYLVEDPGRDWFKVDETRSPDLPEGLYGIYTEFLTRRLAATDSAWRRYRPLLGLLAVAQGQGIPPFHLKAAHRRAVPDLTDSEHDDALKDLEQFLAPRANRQVPYRFYHVAFEEYLVAGESEEEHPYRVYAQQAHTDIARHLLEGLSNGLMSSTDFYSLAYLPRHLYEAQLGEELRSLARDERYANWQRSWASGGDIAGPELPLHAPRLALQAARDKSDVIEMAEFVLLHARRIEHVAHLETPLAALRGETSSLERALTLTNLYDSQRRLIWFLLIAWELRDSGRTDDAHSVLLKARSLPKLDDDWEIVTVLPLLEAAAIDDQFFARIEDFSDEDASGFATRELVRMGRLDLARRAAKPEGGVERTKALAAVARALAAAGDDGAAADALRSVMQSAGAIDRSWDKENTLKEIAVDFADARLTEMAHEIAAAISDHRSQAQTLVAIARAEMNRDRDKAKKTLVAARALLKTNRDLLNASVLGAIAGAQAAAGDRRAATKSLADAVRLANRLGPQRDQALLWIVEKLITTGELTLAHQPATKIKRHWIRATAFAKIAASTAAANLDADKLLTEALKLVSNARVTKGGLAEDPEHSDAVYAFIAIACAQASKGKLGAAAKAFASGLAHAVDTGSYFRDTLLQDLGVAQARAGQHEKAHVTAGRIKEEDYRRPVLLAIALTQTEARDYDTASKAAEAIKDEKERARILGQIAAAQAADTASNSADATLAKALDVARAIEYPGHRPGVFAGIARGQLSAGRAAAARDVVSAALTAAIDARQSVKAAHPTERITHIPGVSKDESPSAAVYAAVQAGADARLKAFANFAVERARAGDDPSIAKTLARETASAIGDVWQRDHGRREAAFTMLMYDRYDMAREMAVDIEDPSMRAETLSWIAGRQSKAGDDEAVRATLDDALTAAKAIQNPKERARALADIVPRQTAAGDRARAQTTLAAALDAAAAMAAEDDEDLSAVMAPAQAAIGDHKAAMKTVAAISDDRRRGRALAAIAHEDAAAGNYAAALEIARTIDGCNRRAKVLAEIARAQASAGQHAAAKKTVASALKASADIKDKRKREKTLTRIAAAQVALGDHKAALRTSRSGKIFAGVIKAQISAGDLDSARRTAALIKKGEHQDKAFLAIVHMEVAQRHFAAATRAAASIDGSFEQEGAFTAIIRAEMGARDIEAARSTAGSMKYDRKSDPVLIVVAMFEAEKGDYEAARRTVASISRASTRVETLLVIGRMIANADRQAAKGMLTQAVDAASKLTTAERAPAMAAIAVAQAACGDDEASKASLTGALDYVSALDDSTERATLLGTIALRVQDLDEGVESTLRVFERHESAHPDRVIASVMASGTPSVGLLARFAFPCALSTVSANTWCAAASEARPAKMGELARLVRSSEESR